MGKISIVSTKASNFHYDVESTSVRLTGAARFLCRVRSICVTLAQRRDRNDSVGLTWSAGLSRFHYFDKFARMNVIDVAVNRNVLYD
jgi:hypothetical protein